MKDLYLRLKVKIILLYYRIKNRNKPKYDSPNFIYEYDDEDPRV